MNNVGENELFAVYVEKKSYDKPLLMTGLPFGRLIDEIVVPYEENKPFFVDGAPASRDDLLKIKIVQQDSSFNKAFFQLHMDLRESSITVSKVLAEQYHVRLEAILRENGHDVTSQVINAYNTEVKPKLRDYLPKRQEIIGAAFTAFLESMKKLSG